MRVLFFFIILIFFCSCSKKEELIILNPKLPQNAEILPELHEDIKFSHEVYLNKIFRIWNEDFNKNNEDLTWAFKAYNHKKNYYGESKLKRDAKWFEYQKENANFSNLLSISKPAIITKTTFLRLFPTKDKLFLNPINAGEGYPFDYLQESVLTPFMPIFVSHFSKDKAWAYIKTDSAYGFIWANDLEILDEKSANKYKNNNFAVFTKDNKLVQSKFGTFYSRIGAIFPYNDENSTHFSLNKDLIVLKSFSSKFQNLNNKNFKDVINQILGQNYGWGGENELRDCSLFTRDIFSVFGLWLPRNSQAQRIGKNYDLSKLNNEEKKQMIKKEAIAMASLLILKGHVMIYGGVINDEIIVLHDAWGLKTKDNKRAMIGKSVLHEIDLGKDNKNIDKNALLLSRVHTLSVLKPDKKTAFEKAYGVKIQNNEVIFENGEKMPYSTEISDLDNSSVESMLDLNYPIFADLNASRNDAGRMRNNDFLAQIYGKNKNEIMNNLTNVIWLKDFGAKVFKFNAKNEAAKALQKVSDELNELIKKDKELLKFLDNPAGTFNYRNIAKTNRLSAHSYGICIDLNTNQSHYWQWHKNYKNNFPKIIIDIFEKHGFIWGGRWEHFDTMHFEYRPEFKAFNKI